MTLRPDFPHLLPRGLSAPRADPAGIHYFALLTAPTAPPPPDWPAWLSPERSVPDSLFPRDRPTFGRP